MLKIAVYDIDLAVRTTVQRFCSEFFLRRGKNHLVMQYSDTDEFLRADEECGGFDLYFIGLDTAIEPEGLKLAHALRLRGRQEPLAFLARNSAHAYRAFRVDALQYLLRPLQQEDVFRFLQRAIEPVCSPIFAISTASGLRLVPYHQIEYTECKHHLIDLHLTNGEVITTLSQRVAFRTSMHPLLADERFLQPHRSYLVNMNEVSSLQTGELLMQSGERIPVPREKEASVRAALLAWANQTEQPSHLKG